MSGPFGSIPIETEPGPFGSTPVPQEQPKPQPQPPSDISGNVGAGFVNDFTGLPASAVGHLVGTPAEIGSDLWRGVTGEPFSKIVNEDMAAKKQGTDPVSRVTDATNRILSGVVGDFTGFNASEVQENTPADRYARAAGSGLGAIAFPEGAEGVAPMAAKAFTGATSALMGQAASDMAPNKYKPIANLLGGLFGGLGSGALTRIPSKASSLMTPEPGAQGRLADFTAEGVPPLATPVSGSQGVGRLEATLSKTPGGARVYQDATQATHDALASRVNQVAQQFGMPGTAEQTGTTIKTGIQNASDRMRTRQEILYNDALSPVASAIVPPRSLTNLENLSSQYLQELDSAPESTQGTAGQALARVNGLLRDVSKGGATLDTLRNVRTSIGREINTPVLAGVNGAFNPYLKQIYGGLSDDINSVATNMDPTGTVASKLALADRYTRLNSSRLNFLDDFLGSKTDGQVYNAALSSGKTGGQTLGAIRKSLQPDQWDQVAGTVLGRMGMALPGSQEASAMGQVADTFSPERFMTNWESMSPEAQNAIFGGTRYAKLVPSLNRLVRLSGYMKDFNKYGAGSPTFERNANYGMISGMAGTAAANIANGNLVGAVTEPAAIFGAGYVAPRLIAQHMTDSTFINKLANRVTAATPAGATAAERALRATIVANMGNRPQRQATAP